MSAPSSGKGRPLPASIYLPPLKKQRTEHVLAQFVAVEAVAETEEDQDQEYAEEEEDDGAGRAVEEVYDDGDDDIDRSQSGGSGPFLRTSSSTSSSSSNNTNINTNHQPHTSNPPPPSMSIALISASHNTPSPAFFASGLSPIVNQRLTTNPSHPLPPFLTRIRHAKQLVVISSNPKHNARPYKVGKDMDSIEVIADGGMVIGHDGHIVAVGTDAEIAAKYDSPHAHHASSSTLPPPTPSSLPSSFSYIYELDASDTCILPGLVDGHTHPVWAGDRVHEFKMKLAGATYMDIHKAGGGIGFTVNHTRAASEKELLESLLGRLDRALKQGTTLLEAKSGYGLELDTELKMLKVIQQAHDMHPIDLVGNYCGGHSVPKGSTAAEATTDIVNVQLPAIVKAKSDLKLSTLEMIDVFCEKGVFEIVDTRTILQAGKDAGLAINFHGDELSAIQAAELGAELHATAISHLEHISDIGMKNMADQGVVGTLLPATAYILRIKPPPAKKMIEQLVPVALGSDFNPNCHSISMPFAMNLACVYMGMTLEQSLNAATINAAGSLNKAGKYGSLAAGKMGDFFMLEASSWEHLIYEMVDPPITQVWKNGKLVWRNRDGRVQ